MIIKCPKCGGSVIYDAESGMMKCTACQQEYDNAAWSKLERHGESENVPEQNSHTISNTAEKRTESGFRLATASKSDKDSDMPRTDSLERKEAQSFQPSGIGDEELREEERIIQYMDLNLYKCTSCGAQLMLSGTESSTFCSFCGLPTIVFDRVSKEERPDKIMPFKLTKEQALLCIQDRIGYGKFIPDEIKKLSVEDIRGIYIPYWLYTAYIRKNMTLRRNANNHTYTYHRDASCTYEHITADASLKLNNIMSDRLDPYYMNELEDFDSSYLSGFFADKYDVPADAVQKKIKEKACNLLDTAIIKSCSGPAMKTENSEEYHVNNIDYALLPAYFVTLRYENDVHLILVNGQTGKVVTDLPAVPAKIKRYMAINAAVSCAIYSLINILIFSFNDLGASLIAFLMPLSAFLIIAASGCISKKRYEEEIYNLNSKVMMTYVHERSR